MMDYNYIPVKIRPGTIFRFLIRPGKYDSAIRRGMDRRTGIAADLHPVMRITRPVGGGGVPVRWVY
jgi:hypothetical protein